MNWTEELKMSIRKTARKGRRSKSKDVSKGITTGKSIDTGASSKSNDAINESTSFNNPDLAIDIKLDLELQDGSALPVDNRTQNRAIVNTATEKDSKDAKLPNNFRRISGKWTNSGLTKNSKSKKGTSDEVGLSLKSLIKTPPIAIDDIPSIPDMDELQTDVAESLTRNGDQMSAVNTSNSDQILHNILANADGGLNLLCLTKSLQPIDTICEPDEVWDIDRLFTNVMAEINAEKNQVQLIDIRQKKSECIEQN